MQINQLLHACPQRADIEWPPQSYGSCDLPNGSLFTESIQMPVSHLRKRERSAPWIPQLTEGGLATVRRVSHDGNDLIFALTESLDLLGRNSPFWPAAT